MISNFKNLEHFKFKPGSATKPVPGFKFHIVDETTGKPSKAGEKGLVYVKLPTPPSCSAYGKMIRDSSRNTLNSSTVTTSQATTVM
jgi:acyl-coenzyme A synthetase/AMP-(fatty) acid ligase